MIRPFLTSLGCPKVLRQKKILKILKKWKKIKKIPPGIHPIYKCAKFQHD